MATYYIDDRDGSDLSGDALSAATAVRSLDQFKALVTATTITLAASDVISFRRKGTYVGSIDFLLASMIITAHGFGRRPDIMPAAFGDDIVSATAAVDGVQIIGVNLVHHETQEVGVLGDCIDAVDPTNWLIEDCGIYGGANGFRPSGAGLGNRVVQCQFWHQITDGISAFGSTVGETLEVRVWGSTFDGIATRQTQGQNGDPVSAHADPGASCDLEVYDSKFGEHTPNRHGCCRHVNESGSSRIFGCQVWVDDDPRGASDTAALSTSVFRQDNGGKLSIADTVVWVKGVAPRFIVNGNALTTGTPTIEVDRLTVVMQNTNPNTYADWSATTFTADFPTIVFFAEGARITARHCVLAGNAAAIGTDFLWSAAGITQVAVIGDPSVQGIVELIEPRFVDEAGPSNGRFFTLDIVGGATPALYATLDAFTTGLESSANFLGSQRLGSVGDPGIVNPEGDAIPDALPLAGGFIDTNPSAAMPGRGFDATGHPRLCGLTTLGGLEARRTADATSATDFVAPVLTGTGTVVAGSDAVVELTVSNLADECGSRVLMSVYRFCRDGAAVITDRPMAVSGTTVRGFLSAEDTTLLAGTYYVEARYVSGAFTRVVGALTLTVTR